jgi:hypothetical protein
LWVLAVMASPLGARADTPLHLALFKTASDQPELKQLAAAVDPLLHSELGQLAGVEVVALPALDLPGLQLAVDCVGETPACLSSAATQAQAEGLVAPALTKTDSAVVLSLLLYDPRKTAPIQAVTRRFSGSRTDQQVLDVVPALVRELFDVAPAAPPPSAAEPGPSPLPSEPPPVAADKPSLILPIVLGASGAVLIGAGVGLGLAAKSTEDAYAARHVTNVAQAKSADDKFSSASTCAALSNVGFALGGAALIAGVIVFVVKRHGGDDEPPPERAHGPRLEAGLTQLTLTTTWN